MISVVVPPYAEPVHLTDMKKHLKAPAEITEDDALISSQITAARDVIETATGANVSRRRVLVAATFAVTLDGFTGLRIELPLFPLISVSSITYVDTAGVTQTLSASVYIVNLQDSCIYLAYLQTWPSTRGGAEDRVTITFIAGTMATFTAAPATDIVTVLGRSFTVGDRVRVLNSGGSLPAGLIANIDYFVIAGPKLSLTLAGTAVDITTAGIGTQFIGLDVSSFESARAGIKMKVSLFYVNRGDGGGGNEMKNAERAIESLVGAIDA